MIDIIAYILMLFSTIYLQPGNTWTYVVEPEHSLRIMEVVKEQKIGDETFFLLKDNSPIIGEVLVRKAPGYLEVKDPKNIEGTGEKFPLIKDGLIPFFFLPDFIIETRNISYTEVITPAGTILDCMVFDLYIKSKDESSAEAKFEGRIWYKKGIGIVKAEGTFFSNSERSMILSSYYVEKLTLAIFDLEELGTAAGLGKTISETLCSHWIESNEYKVVERALLKKVLEEHELNITGLIDVDTAVKVGKLLGTNKVLAGTVSKINDEFIVNIRLIDVKTGLITKAQTIKANIEKELLEKIIAIDIMD